MGNLWVPLDDDVHSQFKKKHPRKMVDVVREWILSDIGWYDDNDQVEKDIIEKTKSIQSIQNEVVKLQKIKSKQNNKRMEKIDSLWPSFITSMGFDKQSNGWKPQWEDDKNHHPWWSEHGIKMTNHEIWERM